MANTNSEDTPINNDTIINRVNQLPLEIINIILKSPYLIQHKMNLNILKMVVLLLV